ncbi:hypothetical protein PLICRDRAFT_35169 [Plicaturopsis crispa FD-325 SS-3]|nr:hypothetical protein PLICRDRAFT_35169 [Plicaturopsis crispa FD-325 SS-3]
MRDPFPFGSWSFTVVRAHGLHFLRPEKSWRPIVEVAAGEHQRRETVLGCDGQNPNLKDPFFFHESAGSTKLEIKIYHKSQSKKKGKKRNLVSSTSVSLGEVMRKQGPGSKSEIRLSVGSMMAKRVRGKPLGGAYMIVKVSPPNASGSSRGSPSRVSSPVSPLFSSNDDSGSETGPLLSPLPTDHDENTSWLDDAQTGTSTLVDTPRPKLRRRKVKGYALCTDDELASSETDDGFYDDHVPEKPPADDSEPRYREPWLHIEAEDDDGQITTIDYAPGGGRVMAVMPSLLPLRYSDQISVASSFSVAEWVLDAVSPYQHFKDAQVDSDWERILTRLQTEWYYIGGSLVSLAALFAAVFGFSSGTLFPVDGVAQRAVAVGSISSGVGISIDAWFIFSYSGADATKFQRKAMDVFGTYFFFCISARLPALCMLTSALALMLFLLAVAWDAWPSAVLAICFFAGITLSLQFILYGVHRFVKLVISGIRAIARGVQWLRASLRRSSAEAPSGTASAAATANAPAIPPRSVLRPPPRSISLSAEK